MIPYDGQPAPEGGWIFGKDGHSSHVARIYFKDGNKRSWWTRDWKHEKATYDTKHGFSDLMAGLRRHKESIDSAIIFEKKPQDFAKYKFTDGKLIPLSEGGYSEQVIDL